MARKTRPYWTCKKCRYRNPSIKRKCLDCGTLKAKRKVSRKQKPVDDYAHYVQVARVLHGVEDERCCVCGKPPSPGRRHDRDHDHRTGDPRGLACPLDNMLMKYWQLDAAKAQLIADYLKRAELYPEKFTKPEDQLEERP